MSGRLGTPLKTTWPTKRVVMLMPYWTQTVGGPSVCAKNLKEQLEAIGFEVAILSPELPRESLQFSRRPFLRELEILWLLNIIRPDVIHIQCSLHLILPALVYRLFFRKSKIIFTFQTQPSIHDWLDSGKRFVPTYSGLSGKFGTQLLAKCDRVISVSRSLIENINGHTDMAIRKYSVVPNGAVPILLDNELDSTAVWEGGSQRPRGFPILSSVGVFSWDWKVKGHEISIAAVRILKDHFPEIRLMIAGDGQYRRRLEAFALHNGVVDNVIFCGNLRNPDPVVKNSDIYVHMALNEGCSLAIIEAMMARKTVIAANRGGNSEIIQHMRTGLLVEPGPQALAEAVLQLMADAKLREMLASNARAEVLSRLTWTHIAESYRKVYAEA